LTNGLKYSFRVYALNFNGKSDYSDIASYYSCVTPTGFAASKVVSQTSTQITISWMPPVDDGGCSILSYAIYRDDGNGGTIGTEVNSVNDVNVRDRPSLSQFSITNFPTGSVGKNFRFKIFVKTT
jgi:hypothetical protein